MDLFDAYAKLIDSQPVDGISKALDDVARSEIEKINEQRTALYKTEPFLFQSEKVGPSIPEQLEKLSQQVADYKSELADNNDQAHMDSVKERRHAWTIAVLGWIVSPLIALAIEHFSEIIEFFRSLF